MGPPANLFKGQMFLDDVLSRRYSPQAWVWSASIAEEDRVDQAGRLATNLREVAVAATSDKEHIQQMTTQNEDLMKVVRKQ